MKIKIEIGNWGLKLEIGIETRDWNLGLRLGIGILDRGLGLNIGIWDGDWRSRLDIRDLGLGL